jgi:hypothetical protein
MIKTLLKTYIHNFLKKYAITYPVPKIAIIVRNPADENTAIPDKAAPEVQPLPNWDPMPNKTPPDNAKTNLKAFPILGPLSIFHVRRPDKNPDKNAPINNPKTSNTNHDFKGEESELKNEDIALASEFIMLETVTTALFAAPLAPNPRPEIKTVNSNNTPSKNPAK